MRLHARPEPATEGDTTEQALDCLSQCLDKLKPQERHLIVEYYRDAKRARINRRRDLARQLGISMNALAIRAWRLRASLERAVAVCNKRR